VKPTAIAPDRPPIRAPRVPRAPMGSLPLALVLSAIFWAPVLALAWVLWA
jgi:hypothetical protein